MRQIRIVALVASCYFAVFCGSLTGADVPLPATEAAKMVDKKVTVSAAQVSIDGERPVLRVVYFVPSDRQPEPDHLARLDRTLSEIQRFFREGMKQNGYGEMAFEIDRDANKALRVHTVQGSEPMRGYDRKDADKARDKVRKEVKEALSKAGLDFERETVLIFQVLLEWQGAKAVEIGPFSGGGNAHKGSALVFDDARLDPRLLPSKQPGGYYNRPVSLGEFNTHQLGGIAHELGHAFGLAHERERLSEQLRKGWSIMGGGNHTYGRELRGEGRGAFLTAAAAFPLSLHPHFTGKKTRATKMTCEVTELTGNSAKGKLTLTGRLQGGPRVVGLVVYNDPQSKPGAYDAQGGTCLVDAEGKFQIVFEDLQAGSFELLFRAYGETGDMKELRYHYQVDRDARPDVSTLSVSPLVQEALVAYRAKDLTLLAEIAAQAKKQSPRNDILVRKVEHLQKLALPEKDKFKTAAGLPATVKAAKLTDLEWADALIGLGTPLRNQVPSEEDSKVLLEVDGGFFESGLFAHAPARHTVRLDRKWKSLTTKFGLQDGHDGSVIFVLKSDGKELFRSQPVRDHKVQQQTVTIAGVSLLEFVVEDAGDGTKEDWGVWLAPELRR